MSNIIQKLYVLFKFYLSVTNEYERTVSKNMFTSTINTLNKNQQNPKYQHFYYYAIFFTRLRHSILSKTVSNSERITRHFRTNVL